MYLVQPVQALVTPTMDLCSFFKNRQCVGGTTGLRISMMFPLYILRGDRYKHVIYKLRNLMIAHSEACVVTLSIIF